SASRPHSIPPNRRPSAETASRGQIGANYGSVVRLAVVASGGASRPQCRHSAGAGAPAGRGTRRGVVIVTAASNPPAAHTPPDRRPAVWNPAASASGCRYALPVMPASAGSTATASSPPNRATSLLTAEAMPECCAGAALIAVAVSGATVIARPSPKTTTAGSTYTT